MEELVHVQAVVRLPDDVARRVVPGVADDMEVHVLAHVEVGHAGVRDQVMVPVIGGQAPGPCGQGHDPGFGAHVVPVGLVADLKGVVRVAGDVEGLVVFVAGHEPEVVQVQVQGVGVVLVAREIDVFDVDHVVLEGGEVAVCLAVEVIVRGRDGIEGAREVPEIPVGRAEAADVVSGRFVADPVLRVIEVQGGFAGGRPQGLQLQSVEAVPAVDLALDHGVETVLPRGHEVRGQVRDDVVGEGVAVEKAAVVLGLDQEQVVAPAAQEGVVAFAVHQHVVTPEAHEDIVQVVVAGGKLAQQDVNPAPVGAEEEPRVPARLEVFGVRVAVAPKRVSHPCVMQPVRLVHVAHDHASGFEEVAVDPAGYDLHGLVAVLLAQVRTEDLVRLALVAHVPAEHPEVVHGAVLFAQIGLRPVRVAIVAGRSVQFRAEALDVDEALFVAVPIDAAYDGVRVRRVGVVEENGAARDVQELLPVRPGEERRVRGGRPVVAVLVPEDARHVRIGIRDCVGGQERPVDDVDVHGGHAVGRVPVGPLHGLGAHGDVQGRGLGAAHEDVRQAQGLLPGEMQGVAFSPGPDDLSA